MPFTTRFKTPTRAGHLTTAHVETGHNNSSHLNAAHLNAAHLNAGRVKTVGPFTRIQRFVRLWCAWYCRQHSKYEMGM